MSKCTTSTTLWRTFKNSMKMKAQRLQMMAVVLKKIQQILQEVCHNSVILL